MTTPEFKTEWLPELMMLTYRDEYPKDKMFFMDVLLECCTNKELVKEFNRLQGTRLFEPKAGIIAMIDQATGYDNAQLELFIDFCWSFVWLRLPKSDNLPE